MKNAREEYNLGNFEKAYLDSLELTKMYPNSYQPFLLVALSAFNLGKGSEGVKYLEFAHSVEANYETSFTLGDAYANIGKTTEAIALLEEAISFDRNSFDALERIGRVMLFQKKDNNEAIPYLENAIRVREDNYGYYHLGIAYSRNEQFDKAMKCFLRAQEISKMSNSIDKWLNDNLLWAISSTEKKTPLNF